MTGTELIQDCLGHIGNRQTGQIGPDTSSESARKSINKGLMFIAKKYDTYDLENNVTIDVSSSNYSYSLPTSDDSSNTIRIKSCEVARLQQDDETTGRSLEVVPMQVFDRRYPIMDSSRTGRPATMAAWNTTVKLYPWPDDDYSLYMRVNTWPTLFTAATLANNSPLNEEWDAVVVAYATMDLFAKLQQPKDSNTWAGILNTEMKTTRGALAQGKNQHISAKLRDTLANGIDVSGYEQDPFVKSMR